MIRCFRVTAPGHRPTGPARPVAVQFGIRASPRGGLLSVVVRPLATADASRQEAGSGFGS
jgi:hypothetical protein